MGRSIGRGFATVLGAPWIVGATIGLPAVLWVAAVLAGFRGPVGPLSHALAFPPVSTWTFDGIIPTAIGGGTGIGALLSVVATVVVRAAIQAALAGLIVDQLEGGSASHWSIVRGLRAFPVALAVSLAGFVSLTVGAVLGSVAGGLALFAQIGILVLGVYLLAFAPFVAISEHIHTREAFSKAVRAARMPGAGNLTFASVYAVAAIVLFFVPKPGSLLGVNPSFWAWLVVLATSVLHVAFQAAFAYRYLAVADEVPEPAPRPEPARRGRR
jgi:hypothetical protein